MSNQHDKFPWELLEVGAYNERTSIGLVSQRTLFGSSVGNFLFSLPTVNILDNANITTTMRKAYPSFASDHQTICPLNQ